MERVIVAPEALSIDQRTTFRRDAVAVLDRMAPGERLVVDLSPTRVVDSAGLGALILLQRHAERRRLAVRLVNASTEMRFLLRLTKLEDLFEIE